MIFVVEATYVAFCNWGQNKIAKNYAEGCIKFQSTISVVSKNQKLETVVSKLKLSKKYMCSRGSTCYILQLESK